MIIEASFEQGTTEWHEARLKSIGGTDIEKIITSTGKPSKQRESFLYDKASQIITGRCKPIFETYEMKWGHEYEPEARVLFQAIMGIKTKQCAMIFEDENRNNHVSPDGIVPELRIGLEIKCPQLKAHHEYLQKQTVPTKYKLQIQKSLAITGWLQWYFVSYFPGIKPLIIPVERDEELITTIKAETSAFLVDLNNLLTELR